MKNQPYKKQSGDTTQFQSGLYVVRLPFMKVRDNRIITGYESKQVVQYSCGPAGAMRLGARLGGAEFAFLPRSGKLDKGRQFCKSTERVG
jgi:hypothetical protein